MTQPKTASKFTPGPDSRRNYWMDCGCMVNRIITQRCSLHAKAPEMYELLDQLADRTRGEDAVLDIGRSEWANLCQKARRIKAEIDGVE